MSRTKPILLVAIMLGVGLAGCLGGGETSTPQDDAQGPQFSDETGAVVGLVTTQDQLPLEGAQVAIINLEKELVATTSDSGQYTLSDVPPGTHTVAVQKLGFESKAQKVDVVGGEETRLDVALEPVPIDEPWAESLPHAGQYGIGFAFVLSTICLGCNSEDRAWFMFGGYPDDFAGMVVEAQWETADYFGFDLLARESSCGEDGETSCVWYRTRSQSPVHFLVEPCGDYTGEPNFGRSPMPCTEEEFDDYRGTDSEDAHLETWYIGLFQEETHTLDPVCTADKPALTYEAGCYGVGPAPETRWDTWVTIFHKELPPGAESYTAFPDA